MKEFKQVTAMRTDLNMRKGKMIAQGAHAAIGAADAVDAADSEPFNIWQEHGTTKICVKATSEKELMQIYVDAVKAKIPVYLVTDSGRTEFGGVPTRTCLAIGPWWSDEIDKITGELVLL